MKAEKPLRRVVVRIFTPGNTKHHDIVLRAAMDKQFNRSLMYSQVEEIKRKTVDELPLEEYAIKKVTDKMYHLVWVRSRLEPGMMTPPVVAKAGPE
jgi:hypothetical protein